MRDKPKEKLEIVAIVAIIALIVTVIAAIIAFLAWRFPVTPEQPPLPSPTSTVTPSPEPTPTPEQMPSSSLSPPTHEPPPLENGDTSLLNSNPVRFTSGWVENEGIPVDSLGQRHTEMLSYITLVNSARAEYFVGSDYLIFRGRLAAHRDHFAHIGPVQLRVYLGTYVNDRLEYTLKYISPDITITTIPFDFEVDIQDAEYIRIENSGNVSASRILIMNPVLSTTTKPSPSITPEPTLPPEGDTSLLNSNLVRSSDGWTKNTGIPEDSLGQRHTEVLSYITLRNSATAEYFVNENYSILRGRLAAHRGHFGHNEPVQLRVYVGTYVNDTLVYRLEFISRDITITTIPFDFEVDIRGAQFIRIENSGDVSASRILVMNPVLER